MRAQLPNIKYLHIVRGLAAVLVVFFHAKYVFWVGGTIYKADIGLHTIQDYLLFSLDMMSSCGKECVIVFFILSAFVIKYSYGDQQGKWGSFYKIRALRIYLPFLFSLIFSIIVLAVCIHYINPAIYTDNLREYNSRLFKAYNEFSFGQVIKTVFFIEQGEFSGANYAYWSLGHELIFYLLFPLYNLFDTVKKYMAAVLFICLFLLTGLQVFYYQVFFIGGLLLYDYFAKEATKPVIKNKLIYIGLLVLLFIAVNISNRAISEKFSDIVTLFYSFFIFDYILHFVRKENKPWMKLGDISYTLYLNHLPLLLIFYSFITKLKGRLVFYDRGPYYLGVLFALILAIPLYYLVEKPSINLIKKLRR